MPFFNSRPRAPLPVVSASDLAAVSARLDAVVRTLEEHKTMHVAHGVALAHMPDALLERVHAEVRDVAADLAKRAWVAAKSEAIERGTKWALRAGFAAVTAYGLTWVHALLGVGGGGK